MKHTFYRASLFSFGLLFGIALPAFGKAKAPAAGAVNFERAKSRIDALLTQRLKLEPLPDPLPNPFQLVATLPPQTDTDKNTKPTAEALPPGSDSEMLLYYGASLRISGTVRINDQTHLVINQSPHKEGDIVTVKSRDGTAKLRILGIAPGELTLGLNDAVQVIKFKK